MIGALLFAVAWAGPADDLLAAVDAASNQGNDAHLVLRIETTETSGAPASRTLEIWQKGTEQRLVAFTEPARLAGVALLVPDGDTVYLYLPSYGRVRRIVGEAHGDAFMGTDFAMEDLARLSWADEWTPELVAPDHLRLVPKEGADTSSAKVDLWVRPDHLPAKVEHYDASGTLLRRIAFDDVRTVDGRPLAHAIVVEDVAKSRTTTATVAQAAFDKGIDDAKFSVQELGR
jgi:outer membrane lipoprotein-sorting protein